MAHRRDDDTEEIELDLLLEALSRRYGQDFRDYSRASLRRRIRRALAGEGLPTISALQERVLRDRDCLERLVHAFSINVTAMFRDPEAYLALRRKVVPWLRTYPSVRIWHVGCSSGEEVYSLAILLHEEGLLERVQIHATDMSAEVLRTAAKGVFPLASMREYTGNYLRSGPRAEFSDYYTARHDHALFADFLRRHVTFHQHNLSVDGCFNEFQLILCRNVLIYFGDALRERVHDLIRQSLVPLGVLVLGQAERIDFTPHAATYEPVDEPARIYRRVG